MVDATNPIRRDTDAAAVTTALTVASIRSGPSRRLGPDTDIEAITSPSIPLTGAASAVKPIPSSSIARANPCRRIGEFCSQGGGRGEGVRGEPGQFAVLVAGRLDDDMFLGSAGVGRQDLAVRGRVNRIAPPHPVVDLQRRGALDLVEVERLRSGEDDRVDGFAGGRSQLAGDRAALPDDVEPHPGRAGSLSTPTLSRYRPRSGSCSAKPCASSVASSLDAVDLWTLRSPAILVTPNSPSAASNSRIVSALSTDWTDPTPSSLTGRSLEKWACRSERRLAPVRLPPRMWITTLSVLRFRLGFR